MNIKYIIRYSSITDQNILYKNTDCVFYDAENNDDSVWKDLAKSNCNKCYGRGFELWDDTNYHYLVACRCVQKQYEKNHEVR